MLYTTCFGRLSIPERHDAMLRSPKQSPKSQTCSNSDQSEKQLAACGFRFPGLFPAGLEHGKNEQRDNAGQRSAAMRRTRPIARFAVFFALGICRDGARCFRFPIGVFRLAATAAHSGHIKTRPRSVRTRRSPRRFCCGGFLGFLGSFAEQSYARHHRDHADSHDNGKRVIPDDDADERGQKRADAAPDAVCHPQAQMLKSKRQQHERRDVARSGGKAEHRMGEAVDIFMNVVPNTSDTMANDS